MCEPATIAMMSMAMTALSTGMSAMGQMNQQAAMGAQANYQSQIARRNAEIMEANAKTADWQKADALKRGQVAENQQRLKTAQQIGTQTAQLAGQGTDLAGSPLDILGDTAQAGEFDALTIRNNAAREAWGYDVKAWNARAGGANLMADSNMKGSFQPSYLGAGASLLSGFSTLSDKWSRFQANDPSGTFSVGSPTSTMDTYAALPKSYTNPGFG